mgnify:CR=1 FL=1|jgi:hypothetical protein
MATSRYTNTKTTIFNNTRSREIGTNVVIKARDDDILIRWTDSVSARKLATQYLGSPEYYWVILSLNNVSLESDFVLGQQLRVPRHIGSIVSGL